MAEGRPGAQHGPCRWPQPQRPKHLEITLESLGVGCRLQILAVLTGVLVWLRGNGLVTSLLWGCPSIQILRFCPSPGMMPNSPYASSHRNLDPTGVTMTIHPTEGEAEASGVKSFAHECQRWDLSLGLCFQNWVPKLQRAGSKMIQGDSCLLVSPLSSDTLLLKRIRKR